MGGSGHAGVLNLRRWQKAGMQGLGEGGLGVGAGHGIVGEKRREAGAGRAGKK